MPPSDQNPPPISPEERERRREVISYVLGSIWLEGLDVEPDGLALFQRYIAGRLSR